MANIMHDFVLDSVNRRIVGYRNERPLINSEYNRERRNIESYKGREILELIQNAEDALSDDLPKEIKVSFDGNNLSVYNFGEAFTEDGVTALMYSDSSVKQKQKKKMIGNKGTGFRSILGWAEEITIHSDDLHIRFSDKYSQRILLEKVFDGNDKLRGKLKSATLTFPEWVDKPYAPKYTTSIELKIKKDDAVVLDIREQLLNIDENILLFLNRTEKLEVIIEERTVVFEKKAIDDSTVRLIRTENGVETKHKDWKINRKDGKIGDEHYSIIIAYDESGMAPDKQLLYSYFRTDIEFPFPVLLHADFKLNQDRNHLNNKKDPVNKQLFAEAAKLLVDTAIKVYPDRVSYDRLRFLIPSNELCLELKSYEFYEILIENIKTAELFPVVNQKYVVYSTSLKRYTNGLSRYLTGKDFSDLLMDSEDESVNELLNQFSFSKYDYAKIAPKVSQWVKNRAPTDENIRKIAFTAIAFIKEFKLQVGYYEEIRPCFFFNSDRELIASNKAIFLSDSDTQLSKPPTFVNVEFLNPYMRQYINKRLKEESESEEDGLMKLLQAYNVKEYNSQDLVAYFNEILSEKKKTHAKDRWKTLVKWLWNNKAIFAEDDQTHDMLFVSRSGELVLSSELYYGKEYGNDLGEELLGSISDDIMVSDIHSFIHSDSEDEIRSFLELFGISELPRRKSKREYFNNQYGSHFGSFERKVFSCLKFPFILDNTDIFSDVENFYSQVKYAYIEHTYYEWLDEILSKCSTASILKWINSDNRLQNLLYGKIELSSMKVEIVLRRAEIQLKQIKQPYSYVYHKFLTIPWIQVNDKRYCIDDCLLNFDCKDVDLSQHLVEPDISAYASCFSGPNGKVKNDIKSIFEKLSVKKSFAELPIVKMYRVLNCLPDIDGSEQIAKRFYNAIVNKADYDYSHEELNCSEYNNFIQNGKILTNNGFQPVADSFYLDGKDVCDKVAKTYNLICIPKKRNKERIKRMLGVEQLILDGSIDGTPSTHPLNDEFVANFQEFVVMAFTYRIGKVDEIEDEARKFSNIRITICSDIRAKYKTDRDDSYQLVDLDDYEYILEGSCNYYLKIPSEVKSEDMVHNSELSFAIANIFSSYLDVDDIIQRFDHLYYVWDYDERVMVIRREFDDDSGLKQAKELLSFRDDVREEFELILSKLTGKEVSYYKDYIDKIDFDDINSVYNANALISLFKIANINVHDYNNAIPSRSIDLRGYFKNEIVRKLPLYRDSYKVTWYNNLKNASFEDKLKLVENFLLFDSFTIRVDNDIFFDPEHEIISQLEINMDQESIDLPSLYEKNLREFKQQVSNADYIDDFVTVAENMSLVYYGEFEELAKRYSDYLLTMIPAEAPQEDEPLPTAKPILLYASSTPWSPSKSKNTKNVTTTGYTQPKKPTKETERVGCSGEEIVYNYLKNDESIGLVTWVSENAKKKNINPEGRAGHGYDIEYINSDGQRKYVEVKTVKKRKNDEVAFIMSDFEFEFGKKHSEDYQIFFVSDIDSDHPRILVFNDLFSNRSFNKKKFSIDTSSEHTITAKAIL